MALLEEFCTTLDQLTDVVKTITDIERSRAEAASLRQHEKIHSSLNDEQAAILSLKGLEQKRIQQAEALGWKDRTFRQILDTADEEQKKVLLPRFRELDESLSLLKEVRKSADRIIGVRIHELDEAIAMAGGQPGSGSAHLFERKYV